MVSLILKGIHQAVRYLALQNISLQLTYHKHILFSSSTHVLSIVEVNTEAKNLYVIYYNCIYETLIYTYNN